MSSDAEHRETTSDAKRRRVKPHSSSLVFAPRRSSSPVLARLLSSSSSSLDFACLHSVARLRMFARLRVSARSSARPRQRCDRISRTIHRGPTYIGFMGFKDVGCIGFMGFVLFRARGVLGQRPGLLRSLSPEALKALNCSAQNPKPKALKPYNPKP